jgi:aldose 1-epimerase
VRWSPWRLEQPADGHAVASWVVHPEPGYPFRLDCTVSYRLDDAGLAVAMAVINRSGRDAPVGLGAHPYLSVGSGPVDDAGLQLPASSRLVNDDRSIPCGRAAVGGSEYDFRQARPVGPTVLDTAFTDLVRDPDGLARVRLSRPDGRQVTVWADGAWTHFQVFTGETLPERQPRRSLAVEPMSCPPNAFASGDGLTLLAVGATLAGTWGISVA